MRDERDLAAFLALATRTAFAWGRWDCCLWLADWAVSQGAGADPAAHLRGRYRTALGCERLVRRLGGLVAVVGGCAELAGLELTTHANPGDVGVVNAVTSRGLRPAGAICTGPRWAMLTPKGLLAGPAEPIAAWRV